MIALFLQAYMLKFGKWALIGAAVIGVLTFTYFHIKGKGYAECQAKWDASVIEFRKHVDDAATRARDDRVPDPFDRER